MPESDGIWIAGTEGTGKFSSTDACPKGCDTTLQLDDTWFFEKSEGIRELKDLNNAYHKTVGNNGALELDLAVNRNGIVETSHSVRYKELGDWIRACYASKTQEVVDRFKLTEDMSEFGQNVLSFKIQATTKADPSWNDVRYGE